MLQGRSGQERRLVYYIKTWVRCGLGHMICTCTYSISKLRLLYNMCEWKRACDQVYINQNYRFGHQAPEDVLPCCQETLQSLQVDYLDLYLIHVPFAVRKTASFPNFTEEDKLYYSTEATSKTWTVSIGY